MVREILKGGALIGILLTGILLQYFGVIDLSGVIAVMEGQSHKWWAPVLLVGLMAVLFAFALPGSTLMLAAGVMFPPWLATTWTVVGGTLGALAAYYAVRYVSASWRHSYSDTKLFNIMRDHAGFLLLAALRVLPGFPHSVINYSAGLLRLPLWPFTASTISGYAVKGFVYTSAVYHATHIESEADAISVETLWPLVALALLLVGGMIARKYLFHHGSSDV